MEKNYFYLQSQLKFREGENSKVVSDVFKSNQNVITLQSHSQFTMLFSKPEINEHISSLQTFSQANRYHLSGFVTVGYYNGSDIKYQNIKVTNKNMTETDTFIKILTKKKEETEKKKPITVDEKIELIKRFYESNGRLPDPKDEIDGCKIGKFIEKLENDSQVLEIVRSIAE